MHKLIELSIFSPPLYMCALACEWGWYPWKSAGMEVRNWKKNFKCWPLPPTLLETVFHLFLALYARLAGIWASENSPVSTSHFTAWCLDFRLKPICLTLHQFWGFKHRLILQVIDFHLFNQLLLLYVGDF